MQKKTKKWVALFLVLALLAILSAPALAAQDGEEDPNTAAYMAADALVVRPLALAATILGTGIWIVSLPFSLFGGNSDQVTQKLVVEPAEYTFSRPLGEF